jgi:hypothetical protein
VRLAAIEALSAGESVAFTRRLPEATADAINKAILQLKNNVAPAVQRVKKRHIGREFVTDSGTFVTYDRNAILAIIVVTRTDDDL